MSIFPVVEQITSGRDSSATTSHVINMPTGITKGDLIFVIFAVEGINYISNLTTNVGWKLNDVWGDGEYYTFTTLMAYILESGTVNLTLHTESSIESVYVVYRISGINKYDMDANNYLDVSGYISHTSGTGINADPAQDTSYVLYGEQDYLFIVVAVTINNVASAAPSNFGSLTTISTVNSNKVTISTAHRTYRTGLAYNPGAFTTASDTWETLTICILPLLGLGTSYPYRTSGTS